MRRHRLFLVLAAAFLGSTARAQSPDAAGPGNYPDAGTLAAQRQAAELQDQINSEGEKKKPDPKRIINESQSLLKEREPEMTAEEYALYEKIVLMLSGQPEFALRLLEGMMNDKAPSPAFEFMLGNAYFTAHQNDKAEARFLGAVRRFPTFIRAWANLGVLYYQTERYDKAGPCFAKAIELGDHEPETFGLLGFCLERTGNIIAAEMAYLQAMSGDPQNIDWTEGLLRIYMQGRQYGRAEPLARSLVRERPGERRYWLGYATVLLAEGRKLPAITMLEVATSLGVAGANELSLLGDLYAEQGLNDEAAGIYARIVATSPQDGAQRLLHFAEVQIAAARWDAATAALDRLGAPGDPAAQKRALEARMNILAGRKQWPAARRQATELLERDPLNGEALLVVGRSYVAADDLPHATLAFESAVQIPAAAYRANVELANIEIKNHHYPAGVEHLERALALERSDALEDYLARLRTLVGTDNPPSP